jgi:hypothetical protein
VVLLLGLAGCGKVKADDFVVQYTDSYCALRLECGDTAGLVFEGADSMESCQGTYGPVFEAEGQGCVLKSKLADECLDAMSALTCPADGDVDAALPPVCATVWQKCEEGGGGNTPPPTEETGAAG